jgi:hypothetical protein
MSDCLPFLFTESFMGSFTFRGGVYWPYQLDNSPRPSPRLSPRPSSRLTVQPAAQPATAHGSAHGPRLSSHGPQLRVHGPGLSAHGSQPTAQAMSRLISQPTSQQSTNTSLQVHVNLWGLCPLQIIDSSTVQNPIRR